MKCKRCTGSKHSKKERRKGKKKQEGQEMKAQQQQNTLVHEMKQIQPLEGNLSILLIASLTQVDHGVVRSTLKDIRHSSHE